MTAGRSRQEAAVARGAPLLAPRECLAGFGPVPSRRLDGVMILDFACALAGFTSGC